MIITIFNLLNSIMIIINYKLINIHYYLKQYIIIILMQYLK